MQRVVLGALAGLSATMAMTAAMRHLWPQLDSHHRYPLPPREIVGHLTPSLERRLPRLATVLAHFGFGALSGAGYGLLARHRPGGIVYGLAVWATSYLGWIPALNILKPATRHPFERNLLMIVAHVVWGATLSASLHELEHAVDEIFAGAPKPDTAGKSM